MMKLAGIRFATLLALATFAGAHTAVAEAPDSGSIPPASDKSQPPAATPGEPAKPASPEKDAANGGPPPVPDTPEIRAGILQDLYTHLAQAKDSETAAAISGQIERLWFVSGSYTVDVLMMRALNAMAEKKLDLALKLMTAVTELKPDYADGWNYRGRVYHLMNDPERSLGDFRRALALEPKHYKALEGVSSVLLSAGKKKAALEAMRKVLELYPQIPEVGRAIEELSREVEGQGI